MAALNMLQFVENGGIDDALPSFVAAVELREVVENDTGQPDSIGDMALMMDFAQMAGIAAMANSIGPMAYAAAHAQHPPQEEVVAEPDDNVLPFQRPGTGDGEATLRFEIPGSPQSSGSTQTRPSTPETTNNEEEEQDASPSIPPGAMAPQQRGGQTPTQIAGQLDALQQEARKGDAPQVLPSDLQGITSTEDDAVDQLRPAADAMPGELPQINQLPGQLPTAGDTGTATSSQGQPQAAGQQQGQQPGDPAETAAELDRQKHDARQEKETGTEGDAEEGADEDGENAEVAGGSTGSGGDIRPGSKLFLDGELVALYFSFGADLEALQYVHEHFFGYYVMRDLPLLARYLGEGKTSYDEPSFLAKAAFAPILMLEFFASFFVMIVVFLPFIAAVAPWIAASVGLDLIDGLFEDVIFSDGSFINFIDFISDLL